MTDTPCDCDNLPYELTFSFPIQPIGDECCNYLACGYGQTGSIKFVDYEPKSDDTELE